MSASDGEPVTLQDVLDQLSELLEQQDHRINDLVELAQEMDEKLDELQGAFDELAEYMPGTAQEFES